MEFLLLAGMISSGAAQDIIKKAYGLKTNGKGVYLFSGILTLMSAIFFLFASNFKVELDAEMLLFAFFLTLSYFFGVIFSHLALVSGPLSITSLVSSFAMVIPMTVGLIFYKESFDLTLGLGFASLVICIVFMNTTKSEEKQSFKWLVYVVLAFIGNGMFSVILSLYQRVSGGEKDNQLMVIALLASAILIFAVSIVKERGEFKDTFRYGWHRAMATGCLNGVTKLCCLLLMKIMNISLISPISSGGSVVLSSIVGVFVYKEKLSVRQYVGILFGVTAIVLLSM